MAIKNKKAFLRIIEVMLAITILSGIVLYTYYLSSPVRYRSLEDYIETYQKKILYEITNNNELRNLVLVGNESESELNNYFFVPENLNYSIRICEFSASKPCNLDNDLFVKLIEKEIYVDETIITANLTYYSPKQVRLFIWEN